MSAPPDRARFDGEALVGWLSRALSGCGLPPEDASLAARVLVRTNARGIETHGIARSLVYVQKLQSGELNPRPRVRYEERAGVLHCHADSGLGQVVGPAAMDHAIALARDRGFVAMVLHEIGHLAALGMFTLRAAEAGMLGYLAQSTPPLMALARSRGAAIGNNPLAFASPVPGRAPLVFDIAASGVARGNVLAAAREGRDIPPGWAIDSEGHPTTDPKAALAGAMLPMAGHKGIGLAMMVECLAGSLTGAAPASVTGATPGSAPARVGAFAFVANPSLIAGREAYESHLEAWLARYLAASGPEGRYPGQRAATLEEDRRRSGIPLSEAVLAELRKVGELTGAPFDMTPQDRRIRAA